MKLQGGNVVTSVCLSIGEISVSLVLGHFCKGYLCDPMSFLGVGYPKWYGSGGGGGRGVGYPGGIYPPPASGGYFSSRYASYWNAFLYIFFSYSVWVCTKKFISCWALKFNNGSYPKMLQYKGINRQ